MFMKYTVWHFQSSSNRAAKHNTIDLCHLKAISKQFNIFQIWRKQDHFGGFVCLDTKQKTINQKPLCLTVYSPQ